MNGLYPAWAMVGLGQNGPSFTTSPGPGSPPGAQPTVGPKPPSRPVRFRFPRDYFPYLPNFYYPYYPHYPFSPFFPYRIFRPLYYYSQPYQPYPVYPDYYRAPLPGLRMGAGQARRLLELAERAGRVLDESVRRAEGPDAAPRDRAAADEVRECMDDLSRAAGTFNAILAELRAAVDSERPTDLTLGQMRALETFAACADRAEDRRRRT